MSGTVDRNSLQRRLIDQNLETLAPGSGVEHQAPCKILEVYDKEFLEQKEAPKEIKDKIEKNKGILYAKVVVANGSEYFIPFLETKDQVYTLHGNSMHLENRDARIVFRNTDIKSGDLVLQRKNTEDQVNLAKASESFDIGGLFG